MRIEIIGSFTSLIDKIVQKDKDFGQFIFETSLILNSKIQRRVQMQGLGSKDKKMKKYKENYS
jgi:hypothetical protein